MKPTLQSAVITVALTVLAFAAQAQKPRTSAEYEIKLPTAQKGSYLSDQDDAYLTGNMRVSQETGKPTVIFQGTYRATGSDPEAKARQYLTAKKDLLGLTISDIQSLRLHHVDSDFTGSIVRLRQTWKGLAVNNNAEITIHISPDNIVDFVMNGFQYGITMTDITPQRSLSSARQQVLGHLRLNANEIDDETSSLMLFRYNNTDYLVHKINFTNSQDMIGEWEAYVNAKTGELLKLEDISLYHHHAKKKKANLSFLSKYTLPFLQRPAGPSSITATGTATIFDPDPLSRAKATYTLGAGTSFNDNNDGITAAMTAQLTPVTLNGITLTGSTYTLVGPYAAIVDFESPAKGLFGQTSSNFSTNRDDDRFEAAMCYYHVDMQMRHLVVDLGLSFLMPHQYTGGIRVDPSGMNGDDNSHYISSSGRFSMGEGGVDDAEDLDVITHEMGHGLHDWATNGGLSQVQGLSEGTGDYNSGTYSRTKGNWTPADIPYNWQYNWDGHNEFWAGRELNYTGVYPGGLDPGGEVHMSGRIWAHANLRIAAAIGRDRADVVFWRGMALTNGSTNQPNAALAVYNMSTTLGYSDAERLAIRNSYITAGYTMPVFVALPVKLVSFDAKKAGKQTLVSWTTASEESSQSFIVERSANGTFFSAVGTVTAAGNSTIERNYSFTDIAPLRGNNYYRLKSVNLDGTASYSKVVLVVFDKQTQLEIFPNPVHDVLTIKNSFSSGMVSLYDVNGKQVRTQKITTANSSGINMSLSGLPNGVYVVKLESEGNTLQSKIVKK
ncbi:MAG TPA: T9SS type A sorting domain-containing protein [Chitinophagaceae bacterium]|jgi:Zn-dependent metalloprotease|nr:T9SS type A sorting domain-containing protein [Chitinophagaceae bacterium]